MATTYTIISSQTLASSATSVTFSAIPSTYTDLCLKASVRTDVTYQDTLAITFNSVGTGYSFTRLLGTGSAVSSGRSATNQIDYVNNNGQTANTFGNAEIYIPSYGASQNKPISGFSVSENNATAADISAYASLWSNTAAITSIVLTSINGANFMAGSTFYLYGIKNS